MKTTMKQDAEKWEVDGDSPKIVMSRDVINRLFAYATWAKGEISGLGEVEVKDGEIRVVDICLLKRLLPRFFHHPTETQKSLFDSHFFLGRIHYLFGCFRLNGIGYCSQFIMSNQWL